MAKRIRKKRAATAGRGRALQVSAEIPKATAGRTVDALTDLIRPVSEAFGLLGDKIALRRQATLLEIAKRTKERLALTRQPVKPIPPKFLVPLLEKASLEDVTNEKLISMWSNLLATAATEEVELLGQYTTILSEVTSDHVRLMERVLRLDDVEKPEDAGIFVDNYYMLNQTGLPGRVEDLALTKDAEEFGDALVEQFNISGVALDTISVFFQDESKGRGWSIGAPDKVFQDFKFYDFENLVRLGLLSKSEIKRHRVGIFDIDVHYYVVTPVGIDLYACCNPTKLIREARDRPLVSKLP